MEKSETVETNSISILSDEPQGSFLNRTYKSVINSFKPPTDQEEFKDLSVEDRAACLLDKYGPKLKSRHLKIIAASGCIGTGVFIGSGSSLKLGGPAALILGFAIMGINQICVMSSVGELALRYPMVSPFYELPAKFLHPSLGFTIGWIYTIGWLITNPIELIAAAETTQYWKGDDNAGARANPVAWVALIYVFSIVVNFCGMRVYGEIESVVGIIKISAMLGFMIYTLVVVCGGPPTFDYIGALNFNNPKPFMHGFKGVISVLISSSFAYGGTEISAIAAAETKNPLKAIPSAVKHVFWRILLFFVVSMVFVGLLIPPTADGLGDSSRGSGSPFVLALERTKVHALPSIFNAVIMISLVAVSHASVYAGVRTLTALALKGAAPQIFCYVDRRGRPLASLAVGYTIALLCFVSASSKSNEVFNWLYAFVALGFVFAWTGTCLCHLRFRHAMYKQKRSLNELLYKSHLGIYGSLLGFIISFGTLGLQFWTAIFPTGGKPSASYFFQSDLSIIVFLLVLSIHKLCTWNTTKYVASKDLDLDSGVRDVDFEEVRLAAQNNKSKSVFIRLVNFFC